MTATMTSSSWTACARSSATSSPSSGPTSPSPAGEFFSLLGPSGCGKTTLLKIIAGFERPTAGRVLLEGVDVSDRPAAPAQRQHGVPAVRAVPAHVGVRQRRLRAAGQEGPAGRGAPASAGDARGRPPRRVRQPPPGQLSGGQQQRVALARALVNLPSALLLDEPLAALDLKLREAMQLELKRIQREVGITFIFVTHDQGEALTMSDRIAVMSRGQVEQIGTPAGDLRRAGEHLRRRLHRLGQPAAGHPGRPSTTGGAVVRLDSGSARRDRRLDTSPSPATRSR